MRSLLKEKVFHIKTVDDTSESSFHFEGYATTFGNTDLEGDIIEKGAFDDSIKRKSVVPLCFNHDRNKVYGKLELSIDEKGVISKGTFNTNDPDAAKVKDLLKMGALDSMSIGMYVDDYEPVDKERPFGGWHVKKAQIAEVSIVTVPANEEAKVSSVKGLNENEREELAQLRKTKQIDEIKKIIYKAEAVLK